MAGAAAAGAVCAAVVWTVMAVIGGNLALAGPSAIVTGYLVVMTVGALAWLVMVTVARRIDARANH